MQSVTGEIGYGGRSQQCLHNETWLAVICEFEAIRYQKEGNRALAGEFKAAALRALRNIDTWLSKNPILHIKNRFPIHSRYGCENYSYFDKYMITTSSILYAAYSVCDESIAASSLPDTAPCIFRTSDHFHKLFLKAGGYAIELDTAADPRYDASGLGRIHRAGAPSTVCLSLPCPPTPSQKLTFDLTDTPALSLCPAVPKNGKWISAATSETTYEILDLSQTEIAARAVLCCTLKSGETFRLDHTVSENGVEITVRGEGDFAYFLPAFLFDGENRSETVLDGNRLTVRSPAFDGWQCRYTANGEITDAGFTACNRNGHYRAFAAKGTGELHVTMEIVRDPGASAEIGKA